MATKATNYIRLEDDPDDSNIQGTDIVLHEEEQNGNSTPDICILIINNDPEKYPNRKDDAEWQQMLFAILGFDVRVYHNQTAEEINELVKSEVQGAFILSIISPGDTTRIHCSDGETILLTDLESHVSRATTNVVVPKVAMFDIYQTNGTAATHNYSGIINIENTLTITSVTSSRNESNLTKTLYEEIFYSNEDLSLSQTAESMKRKLHDHHQQHIEIKDTLQHQHYMKRRPSWQRFEQQRTRFREATDKWIPKRDRTLQQLQDTIDKLIKHRRNINKARIAGSSVSIGGAIVAVVGFGLAPVTFGASLGLSIGGIVVAAAGGATAAGASVADLAIQKTNVKKAQEMLREDQEALQLVVQLAGEIRQTVKEVQRRCPGIDDSTIAKFFAGIMAHSLLRGGNIAVKAAEVAFTGILELGALALRVGGTAARAVAVVGIVLNVLLIPIDIVEIVRSGINIKKGNQSAAVIKLKKLKEDLEEEKTAIQRIAYPEQ